MTATDCTTPTKRCTQCGIEYPATPEHFHKHNSGKFGLRAVCKSCFYAKRREYQRAYMKEYNQRPDKIERRNELLRERLKDPIVHQKKLLSDRRYRTSPEGRAVSKARNPELRRQYRKKPEVKERERLYRKEYNQRPEVIERRRAWARKYREKHGETEATKLSRKVSQLKRRSASGSFTAADIEDIRKAQGNRCYLCGKRLKKFHIDHFIPIAKGGTSNPGNLRLACPKCNQTKSAKHPFELGILL